MAHGWKTRGNSLLMGVLLDLGVGALLLGTGVDMLRWRASRSGESPVGQANGTGPACRSVGRCALQRATGGT
jgi:hypothetical protein